MHPALSLLVEHIRAAAAEQRPLRLRGGGTKDFYGQELAGTVLETGPLHGIVAYEPSELVVTVRAGTPAGGIAGRARRTGAGAGL